jgi:hypothetical protein
MLEDHVSPARFVCVSLRDNAFRSQPVEFVEVPWIQLFLVVIVVGSRKYKSTTDELL